MSALARLQYSTSEGYMMKEFLRGLAHFALSLIVTLLVIPVLLIVIFAVAGIYDSVGVLPMVIGLLCFVGYWLWHLLTAVGTDRSTTN